MKKFTIFFITALFFNAVNAQTYTGTITPSQPQPGQTVTISFVLSTGTANPAFKIYLSNGGVVTQLTTNTNFGGFSFDATYTVPGNQASPSTLSFIMGDPTTSPITYHGNVSTATVLPIDFVSNTATYKSDEGKVVLNWSIASADDAKGFDILRSTDGRNFTKITTVAATTSQLNYKYEDVVGANSVAATYYYKISGVSKNNNVKETGLMAIKKGNANTRAIILNNAAVTNTLTVSGVNLSDYKAGEIRVVDVAGRNYSITVNNSSTITLNATPKTGVYYLKIKDLPAISFMEN